MSSTVSALKFFDSTKDDSTAPEIFRCEHHSDSVLRRLEKFLDNKQLCDVVLVAGNEDKRVNAHRLILSGASEYFSAMFFGSMLESKLAEVKLQDVSGDALELLVHYCYTGTVELREDTVESLLVAADIFQLNDVVTACWNFLERRLHPINCLGIALFAEQRSFEKLVKIAKSFVHHHFVEVSKHEEFLQLSLNQLTELIASDELSVPSEEDVFRSIMKWIEHDSAAREQHFDELLGGIRLPLLKSDFIANIVNPVCVTMKSTKLLVDGLLCRCSSEFKSLQINSRIRSGPLDRVLLAVDREVFKIQCYCPQTNKWTLWNTPEYAVQWSRVAVMSDSMIIVCGNPPINTAMSLNLKTKTLTAFPSLATKRCKHKVVSLHGSLYVIGGYDGSQFLNSVERWDPVARSWSFIKPMQTCRRYAAVAVLNEHVYVVGGYNGKINLNLVEFYDPLAQLWKNAASMFVARWGHGVAVVNGYLYAVGGREIDFSMERYDSQTNTWTMMNTTNAPNFAQSNLISCTSTDNRIFVADGVNCVREYDTIKGVWRELPQHADVGHVVDLVFKIQCYCPQKNKWTLWNTPEYAVQFFHVAVMSDSLIIVGGSPATNTVMSLNLKTKTLTAFPSLATKRHLHSVVSLHDSLYVIGGWDGSQFLNSVERWDPVARSWSFIKPMQASRSSAAVAVLNEHVYVVGGLDSYGYQFKSVEFYDPLKQLWKNAASMNVARRRHGVAVVNGHVYAVGGREIDFSMERYDSGTNTWTMMSTKNAPNFAKNSCFSCTSWDNRIFVADGVNCVREYDTITGVWRELPKHADVLHTVELVTVPSCFASDHFN